jgi:hypothetical protein
MTARLAIPEVRISRAIRTVAEIRRDYSDCAPRIDRAAKRLGFTPQEFNELFISITLFTGEHAAGHLFASSDTFNSILNSARQAGHSKKAVSDLLVRISAAMKDMAHHAFYSLPAVIRQEYLSPEQVSRYYQLIGKGKSHEYCRDAFDDTHKVFAALKRAGFNPGEAGQFIELVADGLPPDHFFMAFWVYPGISHQTRKEGESYDALANRELLNIANNCGGLHDFYGCPDGNHFIETIMDLLARRGDREALRNILVTYKHYLDNNEIYMDYPVIKRLGRKFGIKVDLNQ